MFVFLSANAALLRICGEIIRSLVLSNAHQDGYDINADRQAINRRTITEAVLFKGFYLISRYSKEQASANCLV